MFTQSVLVIYTVVCRKDDVDSATPPIRDYRVVVIITQFPHHFEWTEHGAVCFIGSHSVFARVQDEPS